MEMIQEGTVRAYGKLQSGANAHGTLWCTDVCSEGSQVFRAGRRSRKAEQRREEENGLGGSQGGGRGYAGLGPTGLEALWRSTFSWYTGTQKVWRTG